MKYWIRYNYSFVPFVFIRVPKWVYDKCQDTEYHIDTFSK